jgi:hypothetical protein
MIQKIKSEIQKLQKELKTASCTRTIEIESALPSLIMELINLELELAEKARLTKQSI